ncbi:hypothetical protein A2U01_0082298, partial [Trifolium medium]|nr:hypothetical protein [Trifolium medium]
EFATWWSLYYEAHSMDEVTLLHKINAGFDALQIKAPRGKATPVVSTTSTASKPKGSSTSTA